MRKIIFKEKEVISIEEEEDYEKICNLLNKNGYKWTTEQSYVEHGSWNTYKERTCIYPFKGQRGSLKYYQEEKFKIIEASSLLKSNKIYELWT